MYAAVVLPDARLQPRPPLWPYVVFHSAAVRRALDVNVARTRSPSLWALGRADHAFAPNVGSGYSGCSTGRGGRVISASQGAGLRERDKLKDGRDPIGSSEAQHFLIHSDIIFRITKSLVISPEQTGRAMFTSPFNRKYKMLTLCWYGKGDVRVDTVRDPADSTSARCYPKENLRYPRIGSPPF